jgi:hypothetical protein
VSILDRADAICQRGFPLGSELRAALRIALPGGSRLSGHCPLRQHVSPLEDRTDITVVTRLRSEPNEEGKAARADHFISGVNR